MAKHRTRHDDPQPPRPLRAHESHSSPALRAALLALTAAGVLLTAYLSYTASADTLPAFCGEGSGCGVVQHSRWAMFLGIPMAAWGMLTYLVMAGLAWRSAKKPNRHTALLFVAVGGFAVSAYLTAVSAAELHTACAYCLASLGLITGIMALACAQRPPGWAASAKEAAVVAAVIVGMLHLHYSGVFDDAAGPEDPHLQALAMHLDETGAVFYGAHWCPTCAEQKALFTSSARRLPYVECSTGGRGSPMTAPCVAENIRRYPTWVVGGRRLTGLQRPRTLAGASGFPWTPAPPP